MDSVAGTSGPYPGAIPTAPNWGGITDDFRMLLVSLEDPQLSSADWWSHLLVLLLSVTAFIGGAIHPGFHLPASVSASVGAVSVAAVALYEVVLTFTRSKTKQVQLQAAAVLKDR